MRTNDGYYSCDWCNAPRLTGVYQSGGGSDLCYDCYTKAVTK